MMRVYRVVIGRNLDDGTVQRVESFFAAPNASAVIAALEMDLADTAVDVEEVTMVCPAVKILEDDADG